ncbi:Fc.00g049650.m01.CDS01 [Cosmosporella sp. VM-42]
MLGWMMRRGDEAPNAGDGDTTQFDQPDTPAPVFAARAFKSAIFGTPARPSDEPETAPTGNRANKKAEHLSRTPPKPQGILLTPGTGTSRRKRVSFGHDVKKTRDPSGRGPNAQKRTRLNEALENAREKGANAETQKAKVQTEKDASSDEWEEADDEDFCNHDFTVDLNEPHSESGRFWKEEFEKYHKDAQVELEKMLKYKQLAKSYAKQKDAEAIDLAEKLKEEQRKVVEMEKKIMRGASQLPSKQGRSDEASPELISTLTKQTALAVQYRTRVQELEDQLEGVLQDREDGTESNSRRRRLATSPRTQKTLLETQRELRRARNQVKELGELKDQVKSLKTQLKAAEQRAAKLEIQNQTGSEAPREGTRSQELRTQLREVREESRRKDDELRQLKKEFADLKQETQMRDEDTKGVLERAHNKISDLKKEIRTLKSADVEHASRPKSWHPQSEANREAKRVEKTARPTAPGRRKSFDLMDLTGENTTELNLPVINPPSLRQKFNEDAITKATESDFAKPKPTSTTLGERPSLEKPRWQPFVPRSPRNRAYLGEDVAKRIQNGGITPVSTKHKDIIAPELPALAKSFAARSGRGEAPEVKVDLLNDHYAHLGGPDVNNSTFLGNTSKSTLPPERRAAAIARIERRMAEKKRIQRKKVMDKENVRP